MITVGRILEGAFGVFREHPVAVAIWAGIYFACSIAMLLTMQPVMTMATDPAASSDPGAVLDAMGPFWLLSLLLGLVGLVLYTASMRAVLRPHAGGVAFLRFGMDELRIAGLFVLFLIAGMALFFIASLVLGLFGAGIAMGSQSPGLAVLLSFLIGLMVFGVSTYLVIRVSLAFPLTLHRGHFAIGEAWRSSRNHFWTLFGAALVISVIGVVVSMVINLVTMGGYFMDLMSAAGNPDATLLAAERQAARMSGFGAAMILQSLGSAIVAAVWIALSGGSIATAARLLVMDEFESAEEVFG